MIDKAPFGRTGHLSTRALFGAAAFWQAAQGEADRALDVLLEYGVNHIDTAASYGISEDVVGPWMDRHRSRFFLATKTGERTYAKAREQFHRSLERLRVSSVDLIQLHYLVDPQEWEIALGPGGALEALVEAREQGLVRFIGVTGHDISVARMHLRSLERFDFDSVLLPYNYILIQNAQYRADFEQLMAVCRERNVAVQLIKTISRGRWADNAHHHHGTWYEPLTEQEDIDLAVHYALASPHAPGAFVNTAGDTRLLPKMLDAARRFSQSTQSAPSDEAMQAMIARTETTPLFT